MKKWWMVVMALVLLTGCQNTVKTDPKQDAYETYKQRGTLVVGVDDTFAPMGFRDEKNELVGYDIELAQAVSKKIGIEFKFQTIDWSMKETELNSGNIDMIWNGYSITESRKQQVSFSDPYLENKQLIVVLQDSQINSKKDLANRSVAVQKESSALEAVLSEGDFSTALKSGAPVEFDTNIDCFMDLDAMRCDAIVVDEVLARYVMKQRGIEKYRVLEEDFGREQYGIGLRKTDTTLLKKINEAMLACQQDNTIGQLKEKWFGK